MLEWFQQSLANSHGPGFDELALRLLLAVLFGGLVGSIYVLTQRRARTELVSFATTIVLLTVLIAMVTLVIGNNVARAFSLAGALAIIRFRTVVEDTRDTAFVIFAVVVGMAIGADLVMVPLVGTPILAVVAWSLSFLGGSPKPGAAEFSLSIRLGLGRDPGGLFKELFAKHLTHIHLKATTTARQGSALDVTYVVPLQREAEAIAFVTELNQIEGIQSVELRQL